MRLPEIGEHIFTPRHGYTHHGIYIGDNKVIHYAGLCENLSVGPIKEVSLEKFLLGRELNIRFHRNPEYAGMQAVERALSRLGEDSYNVITNNCEHFCNWVITGRAFSSQIRAAEKALDSITSLVNKRKTGEKTSAELMTLLSDASFKAKSLLDLSGTLFRSRQRPHLGVECR